MKKPIDHTITLPTQLILHVQDFTDALIGPFNNYQEVEEHIKKLKEYGACAEVQAIYPTESLRLKHFMEETTIGGKYKICDKITNPTDDLSAHKAIWEADI